MVERIAARGPKQDFFEQSQAITFHSMTYAFCYTKHPHLVVMIVFHTKFVWQPVVLPQDHGLAANWFSVT
jgi:hypothetical protein